MEFEDLAGKPVNFGRNALHNVVGNNKVLHAHSLGHITQEIFGSAKILRNSTDFKINMLLCIKSVLYRFLSLLSHDTGASSSQSAALGTPITLLTETLLLFNRLVRY